jgi:hypothetical protein
LSRHKTQRCKATKKGNAEEDANTTVIEKLLEHQTTLIENQTATFKIMEKYQAQVSSLVTELITELKDSKRSDTHQLDNTRPNQKLLEPRIKEPDDGEDESLQQQQQPPTAKTKRAKASAVKKKTMTMVTEEEERLEVEVEIVDWDDKNPIVVTTKQMREAFAENPRLQEFAALRGDEIGDPKVAPPYVLELFLDLVQRSHRDPTTHNIRLNPSRQDQVLVKAGEVWKIRELSAASRSLLEAVARAIQNMTLRDEERRKLENDVQNVLATAGLLYWETPEQYAQNAKKPLEVHIANMERTLTSQPAPDRK